MFKEITIHLTEPICNCEEQTFEWGINCYSDTNGNILNSLYILCKNCNTKLVVPHEKFIALFKLDTPYPGEKKEKPKLTVLPGGKVIPSPINNKEDEK